MTVAWFNDAHFGRDTATRGGAPVGMLAELPVVEMGAILFLRMWCEGAASRALLADDFSLAFGTPRADAELERLSGLIGTVLQGGRRPLMRHGVDCPCFGGDESAFATMVACAVAGDREDATVFALALMSPAAAFSAVQAAGPVGLAILGLARRLRGLAPSHPQDFTRH
jgi:hypothetical protein